MILTEYAETGLSAKNVFYYEKLGYEIPRKKDNRGRINYIKGTRIKVKVSDLMACSNVKVLVKCEMCGIERNIPYNTIAYRKNSQYLKTGQTLCVQCSNKKFIGENSPNYIHGCDRFCEYRLRAKKNNIEFSLTSQQFKDIIVEPCHYCGGYSYYKNRNSRGNGIDRRDCQKGYTIENSVPSCVFCNTIKGIMEHDEFIKHIRKIYERTLNYEVQK